MCPACANKAAHGPDDWKHHPYRTHGFNGTVWTHPDLATHDVAHNAGAANLAAGISGEATAEAKAAPAGGGQWLRHVTTYAQGDKVTVEGHVWTSTGATGGQEG